MNILIGYGYFPTTTGRYIEESLAAEHHVTFVGTPGQGRPGYLPDVDVVELIKELKIQPNLFLYVDSGHSSYLPRNVERLGCPTAAFLIDVHLGGKLRKPIAALFDYVFVAQRDHVSSYQTGPRQHAEWLPLACDPLIHKALDLPRVYDVGFVGHIGRGDGRRAQLLKVIEKSFTLNNYRRPYSREEMVMIYNQSKITFNCAISNDVNMRVFEAMACGSLLITDRIGNGLLDLFQEGKHIVTYATPDELLERVAYYLEHDDEREKIARVGQAEVLTRHTYQRRARHILNVVFQQAPGARAPLRTATDGERIAHYARLYGKFRLLDASFDMLHAAFERRKGRFTASWQFVAAVLRRIRHG